MKMYKSLQVFVVVVVWVWSLAQSNPLVSVGSGGEKDKLRVVTQERVARLLELALKNRDTDPNKTRAYSKEAIELLRTYPDPARELEFLLNLADTDNLSGDYAQAERYGLRAVKLAQTLHDKIKEADAYFQISRSNWYREKYDESLKYYEEAYRLYLSVNHREGLARSFQLRGLIAWQMGDFNPAMEYMNQATAAYESLGNLKGIADLTNVSGVLSLDIGNEKKALELFEKARQIYAQLHDAAGVSKALHNMGLTHSRLGNTQQALNYYKENLAIATQLGAKLHICYSLNNIGEVYIELQQYPLALEYLQKAVAIAEELQLPADLALYLTNIGRIYRATKRYPDAIAVLNRAEKVAQSAKANETLRDIYKELAEIHEMARDYRTSLIYYYRFKEMEDIIFNMRSQKKMAAVKSRYDIDKNENRLMLLKKDRQIQQLELERQKNIKDSLIVIALLVFLLAFILFTRYRLKTRVTAALKKEIEEHKETDRRLRESEEKFRTLAEKSVVGICIIQDNVIKYVNPRFLGLFGYYAEEVLYQSPLQVVHPADRPMVMEKFKPRVEGRQTGDSGQYEFRGLTKNGVVIFLESYSVSTYYQGEAAILETIIDVTDRKEAEAELLKMRKLESVGILAGGIANDFNTLLSIIIKNSELLKVDVKDEPSLTRMVDSIEKASLQATELAQKLIMFSEGGETAFNRLVLQDIINRVTELYPHFSGILRPVSLPADLFPLTGDERQLSQVICSLLWNAEEAGKENEELEVAISASNIKLGQINQYSLPMGDYIQVLITDNGRGIPPEQLEKVFDPYFSTKGNVTQKGMGLGLAICYSMIKKNNGNISIKSEMGKGTTVELILPAALPTALPATLPAAPVVENKN